MAIVTIVNQLKSHIHVASINKVVAPGGSLSMDSSAFEASAELKGCVQKGFFAVAQPSTPPAAEPAPEAGLSTVMTADGPKAVEPFKMPEATQARRAAEQPPAAPAIKQDEKSTVWTPEGPMFRKPFKIPEAQQAKRASSTPEVVNGVEVLDLSGGIKTETIDGIEVEVPEDEPLSSQFIETDPERRRVL